MQELHESPIRSGAQAASSSGMSALLGSGAVIVWNDVAPEGREQFYDWHDKEHIPERLAIPGFRRGRRYVRRGHSPEWLTLYEATDLSVLVSPEYLERLNSPTPLTASTLKHFRNTSRAVCRVVATLGSSSGGWALALRMAVPGEQTQAFRALLDERVFPRAMSSTGVVACHLYAADANASYTETAEARTREFDVPAWVVLVEATRPDAAERAHELIATPDLSRMGVVIRTDGAVYSLEICRLASGHDSPHIHS